MGVGEIEIRGPYANQHFSCTVGMPCSLAPVQGLGLVDGGALAFTNRSACSAGEEFADEMGAISLPAENCGNYFVGCTHSWPAHSMAVPPGDYRLCWCHSASCPASEFVIHIGTLSV